MNEESRSSQDTSAGIPPDEIEALQAVIAALRNLDHEARNRILDSAATFLGIARIPSRTVATDFSSSALSGSSSQRSPYSQDTAMSPKDFLAEKAPKTDVERIACLAYYLTHYRSTPHFKTLELSLLNTEAAQAKFSNTAYAANNAVKLGYIVPSTKGQRQLSAIGERFVQALPDRSAAKAVLEAMRRKSRTKRKKSPAGREEEE